VTKKMSSGKRISEMSSEEIKSEVRNAYAKVARPNTESCCGSTEQTDIQPSSGDCCGPNAKAEQLKAFGYDLDNLPISVTESYAGCGNPVALATLQEGEVVLDLGSGGSLDVFVAAKRVGSKGHVIGVDMTPEMLEKARLNAERLGMTNVEFRQGDIEALPIEDNTIDVIISNCVINLAPNKANVFHESFRVLQPGGRMMISDVVLEQPLAKKTRDEVISYTGCIGGAILQEEYLQLMRDAGFERVEVVSKAPFGIASSAKISAFKPKG
jgi:SAM-dependent methyltransferase